jgi:hypothetical protein
MTTLPAIVAFSGDWETYLDAIYELYLDEVIRNALTFKGKPIRARHDPATHNKGFAFWHVISTGEKEDDRLPDLRRCERIRWIRWAITMADQGAAGVLCWTNERTFRRGTTERTLIFCEAIDYLVILEERDRVYMLVSAYPVFERNKRKLKKEWEDAQK